MFTFLQFPFQLLGLSHLIIANVAAPTPVQINVAETTGVGAIAAQATANAAYKAMLAARENNNG